MMYGYFWSSLVCSVSTSSFPNIHSVHAAPRVIRQPTCVQRTERYYKYEERSKYFLRSGSQKYFGRQKEADQYFLAPCCSREYPAHNINFFYCNICFKQPLARHSDNENNIEFEKEVKQHAIEHLWGNGEVTSLILSLCTREG